MTIRSRSDERGNNELMKEYDDIFDILLKCAAEVDMKYWEAGAPDICKLLQSVGLFQPLYNSIWFFIRVKNSLKFLC